MIEPETAAGANLGDEERERSLAQAQALFDASDSSLGSIEAPSKKGFLSLARKGAAVWNAWRFAYPDVVADFSGARFRGEAVDFSGFQFPTPTTGGPCAVFSGCWFGHHNPFEKTLFGDRADFSGAQFWGLAAFAHSEFGEHADFSEAIFKTLANFSSTRFNDHADFSNARFDSQTNFEESSFSGTCYFNHAILMGYARFKGASFSGFTSFTAAAFSSIAIFDGVSFDDKVYFSAGAEENTNAASRQFQYVSFSGTTFRNRARFTNRHFLATTDFGILRRELPKSGKPSPDKPTRFLGIPEFHGCKFHQDTSFDGAVFETPLNQEAARAFRTLKLAMEQLKATREEQRFFRLEMKAEHSSLPLGRRWISTLYSLFSDYGFSLWRPVVWLLSLSLLFGAGYGLLANSCVTNTHCMEAAKAAGVTSRSERTSAIVKYTLASVAPVPGLDKMQTELRAPLFGHHGWVPITALTLEILHKIAALVMVFLFALALRNLFKMKS